MTDSRFDADKKPSYGKSQEKIHDDLNFQEDAYDRLDALYQISRLLSTFEGVAETFPQILKRGAKTFPILTAVLIDNWEKKTKTTVWHSDVATHEQVVSATLNARETFGYLTDSSVMESDDLKADTATLSEFSHPNGAQDSQEKPLVNYIVLPLIVDKISVIGALQLEGAASLTEEDLEFADALANLIAVALDRYYRAVADLTDRRVESDEASEKLIGSEQKVSDLESERDLREGFVSLLTHDLRTPLSAAKMSAQLILQQGDDLTANQALVGRIINNVNRADQMISNLLDANRIRSGDKIPLRVEPLDLANLVRETIDELTLVHGNRFVYEGPESVQGVWDLRAMRRIIENLCNNAIKYGDSSSPIRLRIEADGDDVNFSVQNHGDLISLPDQKSIFQQYRRVASAQSSKKKGWGIGLTLVRGVAEAHGGSVKVESELESGTIFTVTLPKDSRRFLPERDL